MFATCLFNLSNKTTKVMITNLFDKISELRNTWKFITKWDTQETKRVIVTIPAYLKPTGPILSTNQIWSNYFKKYRSVKTHKFLLPDVFRGDNKENKAWNIHSCTDPPTGPIQYTYQLSLNIRQKVLELCGTHILLSTVTRGDYQRPKEMRYHFCTGLSIYQIPPCSGRLTW